MTATTHWTLTLVCDDKPGIVKGLLDPIIGRGLLTSDGELWREGTIYDPENGKTYKCKMWFDGETLRVRGYIGFALLGRSTSWTRVREKP